MARYQSHSESETEAIAARICGGLEPGAVVALSGGLGAGKTAFVRGAARALGCTERVTSPTFTVANEYDGPRPIVHFDLYRLAGEDDLYDIGWDDYLARGAVIFVEWSERAPGAMPPDTLHVALEATGETARTITVREVAP